MTPTILVIDDNEDDQHLYRRALKDIDCRLVTALSAKVGFIRLSEVKPDVILLDYNLPDTDGVNFIRAIGHAGLPAPVIMLTGEGSESVAIEVMRNGADDYLVKDTAGQYLRLLPGVIARVVALHAQREQNRLLVQETARLLHRNQLLMQKSVDGIHILDIEGNIVEANDAFCSMLGYTPEEIATLNVADWNAQWTREELRERFRNSIGRSLLFETVHRRKDGALIDVEVSTSHVEMEGRDFFFALSRDITERKRAEQALLDMNKSKDVFLAMLAHELRNPLAPIRNAAHVLGRLELAEPRVLWAQKVIEEQVNHLVHMVDELLDISRIARNRITLKKETIPLAGLVEQVIESTRPLAERRGHRLIIRLPEQAIQLEGDAVRLSQVLFNLMDNAVKYTPDGGQIELAARMAGEEIEISVRDNGMGITAELLPHVFDLFQQDERTLDRAQGGLGIGLTLVQRLVAMHGGRVKADSKGSRLGSTFTVWLPAQPIIAQLAAHQRGNNGRPETNVRVLIVDDDYHVAGSTAVVLEMDGHEVRVVHTGQAALEMVPDFRPDVVLLDIGLKGMDGFRAAQQLRELPEGRNSRVVCVTGYGDEKTRVRAMAAGCDHFLVKPVAYDALSALLAEVAVGSVLME